MTKKEEGSGRNHIREDSRGVICISTLKKHKPLTRMSVVYMGMYYLTKIFFALLALDFVTLEPDLSNATIL